MARSFTRPTRDRIIETFGKPFVHARSGQTLEMAWRGDRLVFRRYQRDDAGKPKNLLEQPVDWILGSGDHAHVYLYQTPEGELYQLPIAWYSQEKSWGMAPGYDRADHDGVSRRVRHECMFCHNAYPSPAPSRDGYWRAQTFPRELPKGTGCQRCHGPGAAHARDSEQPIVNPARLAPQRRNDVCNSCHLLPAVAVQGARRLGRDVYSFRPGGTLSDYSLPTDITTASGERFEISQHAYRLQQSRCFLESESRLSCLTCHDPHRKVSAAQTRKACVSCHEPDHEQQSDCISCHMPKRRTQDVVHVVMTDHRIGIYRDRSKLLAPLEEKEPDVVTVDLYDTPVKGAERDLYRVLPLLRAGHESDIQRLARAVAAEAPLETEPLFDLANAQAARREWAKLEATARTILWREPAQPLGVAWLGLALEGRGKRAEGLAELRRAVELAPERSGLHMNLALALLRNGREDEAVAELERAIALRPNLAAAWLQLGEIRARRGDRAGATAAFQRTLAIEPRDGRAAAGLEQYSH